MWWIKLNHKKLCVSCWTAYIYITGWYTVPTISNACIPSLLLPVHCCSTVFTDVMSLISSPTLVTLLAERTCISEDYCWRVSLQCNETEIQRHCEVQYVPCAITKCTGKVIRQTIWNYVQSYCLLNLTPQWRLQFWRNVILFMCVLFKAMGVKLLKVSNTGISVFWCDAV